jgi:hypothetical protein
MKNQGVSKKGWVNMQQVYDILITNDSVTVDINDKLFCFHWFLHWLISEIHVEESKVAQGTCADRDKLLAKVSVTST